MSVNESHASARATEARDVLDQYIGAVTDGVAVSVLHTTERRGEYVAVDGALEQVGERVDGQVLVRLDDGRREVLTTASVHESPSDVVARARAVLDQLAAPTDAGPPRAGTARVVEGGGEWVRPGAWLPTRDVSAVAAALTGPGRVSGTRELRCHQEERVVRFADGSGGSGTYVTRRAAIALRYSHDGTAGTGHSDHTDHGPSLGTLLARAEETMAGEAAREARLFADGRRGGVASQEAPAHDTVILSGAVAGQLLALLLPGLGADAVAQDRSPFGDDLAVVVAPSGTRLTDDPHAEDGPLWAPFDDEGVLTSARPLVDEGRVVALLGDLRWATTSPLAAPGSAWRYWSGHVPRPGPSNVVVDGDRAPHPGGTVLRIVQVQGVHLANEVTGEVSVGASAVLEGPDGSELGVTGLSLAGNVRTMLRRSALLEGPARWSAGHGGFVRCPDVLLDGLTVGGLS